MKISEKISQILNPAGGLFYHYCAFRFSQNRWAPFRQALTEWLLEWQPKHKDVVLIGPSGGYCLTPEVLMRFRSITLVEIDPLASWIFKQRFKKMNLPIELDSKDYFSPVHDHFDPEATRPLWNRYVNHSLLFCNILGQLPHLYPKAVEKESFLFWKKSFTQSLHDHGDWSSFHDRLSSTQRFQVLPQDQVTQYPRSLDDWIERLQWSQAKRSSKHPVKLMDHQTGDLFQNDLKHYFVWDLFPGQCHLIEGVFNHSAD